MKTKKIITLCILWLSGFFTFFAFSDTPLTGIVIGSKCYGWNTSDGQWYAKEKAFDGNTSTFFAPDGPLNTDTYVGLAFLTPKTIESIRYVPRNGNTRYLPYGRFEGANNIDFSDAVTIGTISAEPTFDWQTVVSTNTTQSFKFVRYFVPATPNALADLAELQFFGKDIVSNTSLIKIAGNTSGSAGWGGDETYGTTKAFDNDLSSLYASAASDGSAYLSYELTGTLPTLKYVYIFTRNNNLNDLQGATLIGSNNADFSSATTLQSINNVELGTGILLPITNSQKFKFIKLTAPANRGLNLMEFQLYGEVVNSARLSGVIIGSKCYGWNTSDGQWYAKEKVFDGNTSTFFASDGPLNTNSYVGLAFLTSKTIDSIRYVPRNGNTRYLPYGRFEGANNMDFSDAVTIETIAAEPTFDWQTVVSTNTTQSFKFVRYFVPATPNALADLSELQFYGKNEFGSNDMIKISGTSSGTSGWGGDNTYGPPKAFDNDNSSLYASWVNDGSAYLSYDLGEGELSILKYLYIFTRSQNPEAIQGATLKASNNTDFSNPVTLLTVSNSLELSTGTMLPVTTTNTYRYIRLYSPAGNYLNLMEFHLYGTLPTVSVTANTSASALVNSDNSDINVASGAVLTINTNKTFYNVTVEPGAKLNLSSNALTINGNLTLRASKTTAPSVSVTTPLNINGNVKMLKTLDNTKWYFMSFPCDVDVNSITKVTGIGTLGTIGSNWWIKYYDGASRVVNLGTQSNWKEMIAGQTLVANKGYIIGLSSNLTGDYVISFPLNRNLLSSAEIAKTVSVEAYGEGSVAANHVGWNLVGLPYLSKFSGNGVGANYMTFHNGTTYSQLAKAAVSSVNPFDAFFVQASNTGVNPTTINLSFALNNRELVRSSVETDLSDRVQLKITTSTGTDNTNLIMGNNQFTAYEINQDLEKWLTVGTNTPQIYTQLDGINYAYNALPLGNVINLPLGFYTKTSGLTTIHADAAQALSLSKLLLIDNATGISTDLLVSDYNFTADAGTTNSRFAITAKRISTQNLIESEINEPKVTLNNGKIVINNVNGLATIRLFDDIGRMVANQSTNNSSIEITLSVKGIYIIQIESGNKNWTRKINNQ